MRKVQKENTAYQQCVNNPHNSETLVSIYLSFTVIVQLDGVFLQLSHQIVGGHEAEILVTGCHLKVYINSNTCFELNNRVTLTVYTNSPERIK